MPGGWSFPSASPSLTSRALSRAGSAPEVPPEAGPPEQSAHHPVLDPPFDALRVGAGERFKVVDPARGPKQEARERPAACHFVKGIQEHHSPAHEWLTRAVNWCMKLREPCAA